MSVLLGQKGEFPCWEAYPNADFPKDDVLVRAVLNLSITTSRVDDLNH